MTTATTFGIEYTKVAELKGPLMIIDGVTKVSFDELVEIETDKANMAYESDVAGVLSEILAPVATSPGAGTKKSLSGASGIDVPYAALIVRMYSSAKSV